MDEPLRLDVGWKPYRDDQAAKALAPREQHVGAGAGGPSRSSDLAVATRLATPIVCQSGLGDDSALRWTERPTPAQNRQIDALPGKAYACIAARLQAHRALLDEIVALLKERQKLAGAELHRPLTRSERTSLEEFTTA